MHILLSTISYWFGISMLLSASAFILWVEFYSLIEGIQISVFTPGWRSIVPTILFIVACSSTILSALFVVLSVWLKNLF